MPSQSGSFHHQVETHGPVWGFVVAAAVLLCSLLFCLSDLPFLLFETHCFCHSDHESAFCRPVLRKTALGDPEALTQVLSLGIPQPLQAKAFQFSAQAVTPFSSVVTFPFPFVHRVVLICTQSWSAHFILGGGGSVSQTMWAKQVCVHPS